MLIFNKKSDLSAFLSPFINQNKSIGFVPTMGALHEGHLSLLKNSLSENDITVMSIFVNPTQFNNAEDLDKYPRTLERDVQIMQALSNSIIVYAPEVEDIYEGNTVSENFEYDGLENQMEGKHRPGHFDGVGTIVKRLFEIVQPNKAYFGEKDFQQLQIVKKLVSKYNIPVEVIGCPIHREPNGLAMSSRNERLSAIAKEKAAIIYQILSDAKKLFQTNSAEETILFVENEFKKHTEFQLEYFEIADEATLLPVSEKENDKNYRGFIAIFIENIRLIDNISLN
ncbi:MAG: pantoate--beta-alanine ligase [Flavobacterium sp.]|jgi:pantoate--beta-alanine ligase|uniref:pantoate--beta-alanine ligase n=1 Tax=Flavobacterium sp. TaxID=239 RepID=UPI001B3F1C4E|nr:pantoate--beta-alanine ligase [Flavobacterium sp.]MBP9849191.1 pantoate--beta-alanine ligase [Flavobacterium sp.]TAF11896.1 MAG: pantoate--beta-alanine ligase [Flavobacteriia bacterium]WRH72227.1 MAG: pantoate--beta-alanine ligase [Flavobacterium sp.]